MWLMGIQRFGFHVFYLLFSLPGLRLWQWKWRNLCFSFSYSGAGGVINGGEKLRGLDRLCNSFLMAHGFCHTGRGVRCWVDSLALFKETEEAKRKIICITENCSRYRTLGYGQTQQKSMTPHSLLPQSYISPSNKAVWRWHFQNNTWPNVTLQ